MRIAALCLLPLIAASAASAASAQEVDCANPQYQMEMTFCAEQDWLAQDENLNAAYGAAMDLMKIVDAGLPRDQQGAATHLRDGQRAWITFRDQTCAAEGYMMHGGSAEPMVIYGCYARLTASRAEELWQLAEQADQG